MSSPEFRSKVEDLAGKLAVPLHPDPSVTLEACCVLIRDKTAKSNVRLGESSPEFFFLIYRVTIQVVANLPLTSK